MAWGDYDNDGWLDFLLTGNRGTAGLNVSQLWHNNGNGTFSNTTSVAAPGLLGVEDSSVAWGDYDNDGRLDFLLTGYNGTNLVSRLWHNQVVTTNTSPKPPGGLSMVITKDGVILNWSAASDAQTPAAGLTYNLRMGTTPGGSDLVSPHAAANGFRLLPTMGNRQHARSAKIHFPLNQPLYWSVQAVDSAFAGSAFAPEQSLKISVGPAVTPATVPGDVNGDGVVDQSELNAVLSNLNDPLAYLNAAGYYTAAQVQALNLDAPLLQENPTTGLFTLTIGVQKSTNLMDFAPFPMTAPQTTINGQGMLEFQFSVPDNTGFFRLEGR